MYGRWALRRRYYVPPPPPPPWSRLSSSVRFARDCRHCKLSRAVACSCRHRASPSPALSEPPPLPPEVVRAPGCRHRATPPPPPPEQAKGMLDDGDRLQQWPVGTVGSGPRYEIFVARFCTLFESENTRTCENSAQKSCKKRVFLACS